MEMEREGKHLAAAGLRPHHSVLQLLAPVGFQAWLPHPCHSAAAMHSLCLPNWSLWGQMCTRHCFGAHVEADSHLLQHKDLSVGDL